MRTLRLLPPAALALVALAACADAPSGPSAPSRASLDYQIADTTVTVFKVNPGSPSTNVIGAHKIVFPAGAVCDPAVSSYGATEWDKPCTLITAPIQITAKTWTDAAGRPHTDFQPALRFNPDDSRAVVLYLMDKKAVLDASARVDFCTTGGTCVNEAVTDAEVATARDAKSGYLSRRVKHFSGYSVGVGRSAEY